MFPRLAYGGRCVLPKSENAAALEVRDLRFRYRGSTEQALGGVRLRIDSGERVALVGPNGSGKSTLLKLIIGLERIQTGSILVYGHPATRCRHRVAIVPQRQDVDWRFPITAREVVLTGRYVHLGWCKRPGSEDYDRTHAALGAMEITDLADRPIGELSGGQQQRVMLARALAHDADLLLMDEPLNHVDLATQEIIFHTVERLTASGKAAMISTHDLGILPMHFSRAVFLDKSVIADGPVHEVLNPQKIAQAYGFEFHKTWSRRPHG